MAKGYGAGNPPVYGSAGLFPKPYYPHERGRTNNRLIVGPKVDVLPANGLEVERTIATRRDYASSYVNTHTSVTGPTKTMVYKWTHDQNTASQGVCVIPKGNMICLNDNGNVDFCDGLYSAAGTNAYNHPVGISYLNLFNPVAGRLAANRPGIATRGYFELPIFASIADLVAAAHPWGAIIAATTDGIRPGDLLRCAGQAFGGAAQSTSLGYWGVGCLTNATTDATPTARMTYADRYKACAQVIEINRGPVFDGMLEWVQFDDPYEFEDPAGMWTGDGSTLSPVSPERGDQRVPYRDPNSPTGWSYNPVGYQGHNGPTDSSVLQEPWLIDARGIPQLTDGANWQVWQHDALAVGIPGTGVTTATYYAYYHTFGGVGATLNITGTGAMTASGTANPADMLFASTLVDGSTLSTTTNKAQTFIRAMSGATTNEVVTITDDSAGTIKIVISGMSATTDYGTLYAYFRAKGQVAGVPTNIDIARCIGFARFQLLLG